MVSDPVLPFLAIDVVALFLLGTLGPIVSLAAAGCITAGLCGLGILLCLPSLLLHLPATGFTLPVGPPGLSLHFALDPLAACFLLMTFIAGTAIAMAQATAAPAIAAASIRTTSFCLTGTACSLLAADGVALAIGAAITCAATWRPRDDHQPTPLVPPLLLAAVCLLTPPGFAPRFDTIRAAPIDPGHATAATAIVIAATTMLIWFRPRRRCWLRDALTAGVVVPSASYLPLRLIADLSGTAIQAPWGFALLIVGGTIAVIQAWRSVADPDIDAAVACLSRRQAGVAMTGAGLALVARIADLPGAASFAFAAVFLSAVGGSLAGTLTSLAGHTMARSAGTYRLSRLGGLIDRMPMTSTGLAAGLLGQSGILPGSGFASLWLLLQSVLSAPRGNGLLWQLPLALSAGAVILSAALATEAGVRITGIALLGRPRIAVQGTAAQDAAPRARTVLLVLAGLSLLAGVFPGATIWIFANRAIQALTGAPPLDHTWLLLLSSAIALSGYLTLPVLALLAATTGAIRLTQRRSAKGAKIQGQWEDGRPSHEPAAQSAGAGFQPDLPFVRPPPLPRLTVSLANRRPSAAAGLWLLLAAFGTLLLVLLVAG